MSWTNGLYELSGLKAEHQGLLILTTGVEVEGSRPFFRFLFLS